MRLLSAATICISSLVFCPATSRAELLSISDGDHLLDYETDDSGADGNIALVIGGIDIGYGDSWFYSTGGTTTELIGGTVTHTGADAAQVDFTIGDVDISLSYQIISLGLDQAELIKSASVTNNGATNVSGKLANYVDYDVTFSTDDELLSVVETSNSVTMEVNGPGVGFYEISFLDNLDRWEVDEYDLLHDKLLTGADLSNTDNGLTIGDITLAGEADFEAVFNQPLPVMQVDTLLFTTIPEPTAGVLIAISGIAMMVRRRQRV